jgi:elongation factor Tu
MTIADVFTIVGRGTVVTGQVESGSVSTGDTVRLTGPGGLPREIEIAGVEMFRKQVDTANAGDKVGLLLHKVDKQSLGRGDILSA